MTVSRRRLPPPSFTPHPERDLETFLRRRQDELRGYPLTPWWRRESGAERFSSSLGFLTSWMVAIAVGPFLLGWIALCWYVTWVVIQAIISIMIFG